MPLHSLKGINDILPFEASRLAYVEELLGRVFGAYGYLPLRPPLLEDYGLFIRSIGEGTDIVEKEIYSLIDRAGRKIALRPEATASVARAYVQHRLAGQEVVKLFYHGPMFRGERPQAGRNRQFYQMGVEALGDATALLDAEVIEMANHCLHRIGLVRGEIILNSVGCNDDKRSFSQRLREYLQPLREELCPVCQTRLQKNVLRILDCKNAACRKHMLEAPKMTAHICITCREHFDTLTTILTSWQVAFRIDPLLVRGLDYYTKTVFEITHPGLGAQNSVCAGGRYDNLIGELGGPTTGATGFAFGLERVLMAVQSENIAVPPPAAPLVYAVGLGDSAHRDISFLVRELRHHGIPVLMGYQHRSLKSSLKHANKSGARFCLIMGDQERTDHTVIVRDMALSVQRNVARDLVTNYFLTHVTADTTSSVQ